MNHQHHHLEGGEEAIGEEGGQERERKQWESKGEY